MTATQADTASLIEERDALVDALVAAQDRLSALVAMLKMSTETLDLDELTELMLAEALEVTESDAVIFSCAHGRPNQRAWHGDPATVKPLARVLEERLRRMQMGSGDEDGMRWAMTGFPSFPSVGLAIGRLHGPAYSTGDLRMLATVAIAIEQLSQLSRLHEEVLRQATMEKEHQLASRLAQAVLPNFRPERPDVDFFARCTPAALTGGDFMVFAEVDDAFWFAVGDVAGKGLPAAMIMSQAAAAVRVAMRTTAPDDPAAVVRAVGRDMAAYLASVESFFTLAVGVHRRGSDTVALCNAGHSPLVHKVGPGEPPRSIPPTAVPLGVPVAREPRSVTLPFPSGALLVIGTDGLVEQPGPDGEMLGYDAFNLSCATDSLSAAALGELLMQQVETHAAGTPAADDRTLVVLRAAADKDVRMGEDDD